MKHLKSLMIIALAMAPTLATADTLVFRCYASHFVRTTGSAGPDPMSGPASTELRNTVIFFNNGDPEHRASVERLTVRDGDGSVRYDSGPKTQNPHDARISLGRDITNIPPGATFAFSTIGLWGWSDPDFVTSLPNPIDRLALAGALSITVEVFKRGAAGNFVVHARENSRPLVSVGPPPGTQTFLGPEGAANMARCFRIRDRDD